jgi:hypothetical protein
MLLVSMAATAQNLRKAPADVEEALRARVDRFYTLFTLHRFRQAEALVAEDSRDQFYNMQKAPLFRYKIENIEWDDKFKDAKVLVTCMVNTPRAGPGGLPVPVTGEWKLLDGDWFLFIKPTNSSPFGMMSFDTKAAPSDKPPEAFQRPTVETVTTNAFRVEPQRIVLSRDGDGVITQPVVITNNLPGNLQVTVDAPDVPGLTLVNVGKVLPAKGQMTFQVAYDQKLGKVQPSCASCKPILTGDWAIRIGLEPIGQTARVVLDFK